MEFLTLESILNAETFEKIRKINYSRFPIMKSGNDRFIVAILMAKSLIGLEPSNKTIRELFATQEIKLRSPLYLSKDAALSKVMKTFATGESHLGVVCETD